MAFIRKSGSRFQVRQGNNNDLLKTFGSRDAAQKYVAFLHRKNRPRGSNKGASARKRF